MTKRAMSSDDRALTGRTPARGVVVDVPDEVTGTYEGEELARIRARRPTDERMARIEKKHDELALAVGNVEKTVANMSGKLDTFLDVIRGDRENEQKTNQIRISTRGKVIVGVVGAVCTAIGVIVTAALTGCL